MKWKDVPHGAAIGTASLRRQASLLRMRPDLQPVEHRGNVPTRLSRLEELTHLSVIVLARAGIVRLNIPHVSFEEFTPLQMMPAVNQGILCVQFKTGRTEIEGLLSQLTERSRKKFCWASKPTLKRR
ncbi:MAG: hypothetical protein KDD64_07220 [Bdellovibrionales bacterium]|nr:hypothetical protein [Bdellovibrionales bacterium]